MKYYYIALSRTNRSTHKKHQMAAVIVRGGAILSWATNKSSRGDHAEKRAIHRTKDLKGSTIYIARRTGRTSKPCSSCFELIKNSGIKEVVFINEENEIVKYAI